MSWNLVGDSLSPLSVLAAHPRCCEFHASPPLPPFVVNGRRILLHQPVILSFLLPLVFVFLSASHER